MSRYIALFNTRTITNGSYDDYSTEILSSITDWSEVSEEDFELLRWYANQNGYHILERPLFIEQVLPKLILDCKITAEKAKEKEIKYKAAEAKRKLEAKEKRDKKAFDKLKLKFGE